MGDSFRSVGVAQGLVDLVAHGDEDPLKGGAQEEAAVVYAVDLHVGGVLHVGQGVVEAGVLGGLKAHLVAPQGATGGVGQVLTGGEVRNDGGDNHRILDPLDLVDGGGAVGADVDDGGGHLQEGGHGEPCGVDDVVVLGGQHLRGISALDGVQVVGLLGGQRQLTVLLDQGGSLVDGGGVAVGDLVLVVVKAVVAGLEGGLAGGQGQGAESDGQQDQEGLSEG